MISVKVRNIVAYSVAVVAFAVVGGVVAVQGGQPADNQRAPQVAHAPVADEVSLAEAAKARFAAAERACKMLHDPNSGAPRGHQGVEHTYVWSKRRMEAEIEVIRIKPDGGDGEIAAIERHLEWMRAWNRTIVDSGAYSMFDIAATEFYVAEAESILAQAQHP